LYDFAVKNMAIKDITPTTLRSDIQGDIDHSRALASQAKRSLLKHLNAERIEKSNALKSAAENGKSFVSDLDITEIAGSIRQKKAGLQSRTFHLRPHAFRFTAARAKHLYAELIDSDETKLNDELGNIIESLSSSQDAGGRGTSDSNESDALRQYLLLSHLYAKRSLSAVTKKAISERLDRLEKKFGGAIFSQINAISALESDQRQGLLAIAAANVSSLEEQKKAQKRIKKDFVETYKNIVLGFDGLPELFVYLSRRFAFDVLMDGINQIKAALAYDLKASRSSTSPDKLNAVLSDMRNLNCISLMLERIEKNRTRFASLKMTGLPEADEYFSTCIDLTTGAHMVESLSLHAARVKPSYQQGIVFIQETGEVLRELPDGVWSDRTIKADVLQDIAVLSEEVGNRRSFS